MGGCLSHYKGGLDYWRGDHGKLNVVSATTKVILAIEQVIKTTLKVWYDDETNGIEILRNTLINIKIIYSNHKFLISGDMNAGAGDELDYIIDDNVKDLPNVHWYNVSIFSTVRRSKDKIVHIWKFGN